MYLALKHSHMLFVVLSVSLLLFRFVLVARQSPLMQQTWLKIVPHVVDTCLLATAVGLMVTIQQYPFSSPWLTEKLMGVVCYILLGAMALKGRTPTMRLMSLVGALAWLAMVAKMAIMKTPMLFQ